MYYKCWYVVLWGLDFEWTVCICCMCIVWWVKLAFAICVYCACTQIEVDYQLLPIRRICFRCDLLALHDLITCKDVYNFRVIGGCFWLLCGKPAHEGSVSPTSARKDTHPMQYVKSMFILEWNDTCHVWLLSQNTQQIKNTSIVLLFIGWVLLGLVENPQAFFTAGYTGKTMGWNI